MSPTPELSANQLQVLALISTGSTATAAAKEAGVHRNTIANWLRSPEFHQAMIQARHEKAIYWRECAGTFAAEALRVIVDLMIESHVPASVRLRAALAILDKATAPLPPDPEIPTIAPPDPQIVHKNSLHKNAQLDAQPEPSETKPTPAVSPKAGRNETCPCGSGLKFKRCCLGKPVAPPPPPAQTAASEPRA